MRLTKPQLQGLHKLYMRDDKLRIAKSFLAFRRTVQPVICGQGAVIVQCLGMWIGIETDGYTHS